MRAETEPRPRGPSLGAFGEKLRKQREQRGIALEAISNTTKISTRMLRALEDEQFDQLPGGVFSKGFVRAYARQIGLDEEETLAEYLAALRESQIQAQQILPDFRTPGTKHIPTAVPDRPHVHSGGDVTRELRVGEGDNNGSRELRALDRRKADRRRQDHGVEDHRVEDHRDADHRPDFSPLPSLISLPEAAQSAAEPSTPPRFTRNMLAAALLLVTVGLAVWNSRRHREAAPNAAPPSNRSASLVSSQPSATTTQSASAAPPKPGSAPSAFAEPTRKSGIGLSSGATSASVAAATVPNFVAKPAENPASAKPPVVKTISPSAAAKAPSTITLLIRAEKTTWVSITADGKPVAQETLIAPAHTSVRAAYEIVVRAGNAAGISFLLNGKEIPANGNEGEVKTYVFDAGGVRVLPQTQPSATNR